MDDNVNTEAKKPGNPSRELLYAQAAKHAPRAIDVLVEIMNDGDNDNAKMAAARTILAKAIPDLHYQELVGKDGQSLFQYGFLKDFISAGGWDVPASNRGISGSNEVQGANLAQESPQNNDSSGEDKPRGA